MNTRHMHAAIVAGEPSGDLLAARMITGLQARSPGIRTTGIGGPSMVRTGFEAWHPMDALSVFGYVDALRQAPRLIRTWRNTRQRVIQQRPDVFVGVDAPDFNLRLEEKVRAAGIPTVHFVGPSIWAWRFERIHQIRRAVSHMLVLFPFEVDLYREQGVPVTYVGHPLAELIPKQPDRAAARALLGLDQGQRVLALMPGSRESELRLLAPRFLQAAQQLRLQDPDLQIVVPVVNAQRHAQFASMLAQYPVPNCRILAAMPELPPHQEHTRCDGLDTRDWPLAWHAMEAADAVLVASGTATLEAALFKRPLVISYVLSPWMRRIMAWKSGQQAPSLPWVGLPNILERDFVVPELLQEAATPDALAAATWTALSDQAHADRIAQRFAVLHETLNRDTPGLAAQAILEVCHGNAG
ncbi:lipid-A-disaccharide synthase [Castellaniella sp.]|uniref:lipid-A-disaccharide synthase n=1 Tax=Castellaniella sp. TaxID=1955812 RepID=UPI002AFEE6F7|nr:lipid-A-disaccharide synthase [Castellaniella sp.]